MQAMKNQHSDSQTQNLVTSFHMIKAIRRFFDERNFLDVLTPPVVENPGMEPHIHPFSLWSECQRRNTSLYLHTSPEFCMKELLSQGLEKIFTISYCFRDEPVSTTHRPQFIMLEWYRSQQNYEAIMDDCQELINYCGHELFQKGLIPQFSQIKLKRITVQNIFQQVLGIDILEFFDPKKLHDYIVTNHKDIPCQRVFSSDLFWEDLFFLIFLNKIEPRLEKMGCVLLYEYPAPLSALSTIKQQDPRVCERFEIYFKGLEICNCYNELTDWKEQEKRFHLQKQQKTALYKYDLPWPERFLNNLKCSYPKSAGIALGVERLLMALTQHENVFWD